MIVLNFFLGILILFKLFCFINISHLSASFDLLIISELFFISNKVVSGSLMLIDVSPRRTNLLHDFRGCPVGILFLKDFAMLLAKIHKSAQCLLWGLVIANCTLIVLLKHNGGRALLRNYSLSMRGNCSGCGDIIQRCLRRGVILFAISLLLVFALFLFLFVVHAD
jgi:hypothetical protein